MIQALLDRLDFASALKTCGTNDLLPPRQDDKVSGEVGNRFVEHLKKQVADGRYEPDRASFVQVPKPGLTSRPAALLTLTDRVVYEALVSLLRPSVSKYLIDDDVVLWPREMPTVKRWHEFEKSPLATEHRYVVQADVSGFYESIDHDQIEDDLVKASGDAVLSNVLRSFLSRVMGTRRGIPQGLLASDSLATIYLQPVDATMVRDGFNYWRHGDDMIVAAESMSKARGAISSLEDELRQRGLLVNASKVAILTREQYEADLEGAETTMRAMQDEMFQQNVERVSSDSQTTAGGNERRWP